MTTPSRLGPSCLAICAILSLAAVGPAWAATIYVDVANMSGIELGTQTYPYRSIQTGINSTTSPADVVRVTPGVYAEAILVRDGVDVVCVANFAAQPHHDYRLPMPVAGEWEEVLNTDAEGYTGSGVGNLGTVTAVDGEQAGQPAHATIVVPPLATVWLRRRV